MPKKLKRVNATKTAEFSITHSKAIQAVNVKSADSPDALTSTEPRTPRSWLQHWPLSLSCHTWNTARDSVVFHLAAPSQDACTKKATKSTKSATWEFKFTQLCRA